MCSHDVVLDAWQRRKQGKVARSPYGPDDQIGQLNLALEPERRAVLSRADFRRVFDLSVDYFMGMPSWTAAGDQEYQIWMTHTPGGNLVDNDPNNFVQERDQVAYSGDAISMYTHTGTHIDTLNHFGYHGQVWNQFSAEDHLGSRHWLKNGAEQHPPIIGRGILLDIPRLLGVDELPPSFQISSDELSRAAQSQQIDFETGDIVLVRTGRMRSWPDKSAYLDASPGLNLDGAEFLVQQRAMLVGADNASFEYTPHTAEDHWNPVHCFLLAEAGLPILENADLEELAANEIYEFAFIASGLKLRGATSSPVRPIALPLL